MAEFIKVKNPKGEGYVVLALTDPRASQYERWREPEAAAPSEEQAGSDAVVSPTAVASPEVPAPVQNDISAYDVPQRPRPRRGR